MRVLTDAVRMEARRVTTVRSSYLVTGIALFGGVVIALMVVLLAPEHAALTPGRTVAALTAGGDGAPMSPVGGLLAILGVLTVGQDYRYRMLPAVFTAVPRRGAVVLARLAVLGAVALVVAALTALAGVAICSLLGRSPAHDPGTVRVAGTFLVLSVLWAWLGAGLTWVFRSSAGSVSVLLLGPLLVEPLILLLGSVGSPGLRRALSWLPFAAARQALGPMRGTATSLGAFAAGVEFTGFTLVVVAVGALLVRRRPA
jgi:ABC-2 type transport system permease protein